jgi:GPH family glycoside/pentoside/hexuronide:cation symporter
MSGEQEKLRLSQQLTFGLPQFAMALSGLLFSEWLMYFYLPPDEQISAGRVALVAGSWFAAAMLIGRVFDAFADPLVGYWSDRTRSRMGRRLPFLLYGAPVLAATFTGLFFPPFAPGSMANNLYIIVSYVLYNAAFTLVVAPYCALIPEVAVGNRQRVALSSWMAVFVALGNVVGAVVIGTVVQELPQGVTVAGVTVGSGIQVMALVLGVLLMLLFWVPLVNIRERPWSAEKQVPPGLVKGILSTFKNPAFLSYLGIACLMQMGVTVIVAMLPYLATQVLEAPAGQERLIAAGEGNAWAGYIFGVVIVFAALFLPLVNYLVPRVGKKKLFLGCGWVMIGVLCAIPLLTWLPDPGIGALPLFALLAFPVSVSLVLPNAIYADVVDWEAERTGIRREGIYTGATAFVTKAGLGLAQAIAVPLLVLGNSRSNPTGILLAFPVAAVLILVGLLVFRKHPIEK